MSMMNVGDMWMHKYSQWCGVIYQKNRKLSYTTAKP